MGLGIVVLGLLATSLAASAGVLVSLRAATVRQAQQTLSIAIMVLLFVPVFGVQALPAAWKVSLVKTFAAVDVAGLVAAVAVVLAALDLGLFAGAIVRFRRARLIQG